MTAGRDLVLGFDAVRALRNSTGLGNYSRGVLRGLRDVAPELPFHLYSPRPATARYAGLVSELGASLHVPPARYGATGTRALWRTYRLGHAAAADGVTLYHGLTHEIPRDLPRTRIPSVVTFHDLIYHRFPEYFPRLDRISYAWRYRWSAEHATAIVANSEQTRRDLLDTFGLNRARITVVPPARDPRFGRPIPANEREAVLSRLHLPTTFMLSVGTLERRKNHRAAIEALAALDPVRTPPLVLVGRDAGMAVELTSLASRLGVQDRVQLATQVSDADLPAIMQSASLFLFPSLVEGFGMPIVEALSAGIPVIATAGGCFPEAGGPDSVYVPSGDTQALAEAIRVLLDDPAMIDRMRTAGARYAERFDADRLAVRLLEVYQAVVAGQPLPVETSGTEQP